MPKVFTEYGWDLDNNAYGFGRSVEIENDDGSEYRTKQKVPIIPIRRYFRLWVGGRVIRKNRQNFKCVFGIEGRKKAAS